ncbi:MAG: phage major capsid protein [Shinella sp.]|nr:MAG: phage major capsid protein [Shinella sp.]
MQHVMKQALLGSVAMIERKGEEDDPVSIVTKSLEDLQKKVNDELAKVPNGTEIKALVDRISDLEKKANRPGNGSGNADEQKDIERKALASYMRTGSDVEVKAAATDNNVDGGYFVLPTVDLTIRTLMTDISPMRGLAEVVSISTDKYERFYSLGKRGAQWVTERDDRPQDTARPELIKHSYGVAELYAAPAATRTLLDDSAVDLASWLTNNATHDFAETEGEAFLSGTGTDNSPRGLLTYDTAPEKDFTRAWGKFQYVASGGTTSASVGGDALIKLIAALRAPYKAGARFLMNSNTATFLRQIKDADGRYLWAPTGNLIEGIEHPLLGYPVTIDEGMPDIGSGALPIAFGDFRQGYVIVDRQGIRINRDELTQKGRIIFDVYKRVGGGAGDFNAIKFLKIAAS